MAERPRWAPPVTAALALAGLGVSSYLTWVHYAEPRALACPDTGVVNCTKVTTSAQSIVLGIPVAVLGALFFAAMLALCVPPAWRARNPWLERARVAGGFAGIGFVLYLVGVELLAVHAICLWCTAAHVVAFALFISLLAAHLHVAPRPIAR